MGGDPALEVVGAVDDCLVPGGGDLFDAAAVP